MAQAVELLLCKKKKKSRRKKVPKEGLFLLSSQQSGLRVGWGGEVGSLVPFSSVRVALQGHFLYFHLECHYFAFKK
jgi:hypothetical protein